MVTVTGWGVVPMIHFNIQMLGNHHKSRVAEVAPGDQKKTETLSNEQLEFPST